MSASTPDEAQPLRGEIDRVIHGSHAARDQAAALEVLHRRLPHGIREADVREFCALGDPIPEYDCFTFALNLIDCPERLAVRDYAPRRVGPLQRPGIADVLPSHNFIAYLRLEERPDLDTCRPNDLVVYRDRAGQALHAGQVFAGQVVSKWGMKGGLWLHGLWEVPTSYGVCAHFHAHMPNDELRKAWVRYLGELANRVAGFVGSVRAILENE